MGGRWTSLSDAMSGRAELYEVRVGDLSTAAICVTVPIHFTKQVIFISNTHTPGEFQQRFNPRVVDNDPLLQHKGGIKDDVLHTKL